MHNQAPLPQIENIEIIDLLGTGGMALVYKGRQTQLNRIVAVKILSSLSVRGEDGIKRFQKEAKLSSALEHPNIVKTMSFGVSKDGQPYLVMEYLQGVSLAEELKKNGRLTLEKFEAVFLPALAALKCAHEAGLVHRDIKPENIMICRNAEGSETVKLVDFGIAKLFAGDESHMDKLTKTGAVIGSPAYMSPEQCQTKPLDGRADLYSLACVMYESLCGEPPFSGDSALELLQKHCSESPPSVSDLRMKIDIPVNLAKGIVWGLAKDPAARPPTAAELASSLSNALASVPMPMDKVPKLKKPAAASNMIPGWRTIITALVSMCAIVLGGLHISKQMGLQANESYSRLGNSSKADTRKAGTNAGNEGYLKYMRKEKEKNEELDLEKRDLTRAEKNYGPNSQELAEQILEIANKYRTHLKFSESEPLYKRALAIKEKKFGNGLELVYTLSELGRCYTWEGRFTEAEPQFKRALAIQEKELGPEDPDVAATLLDLGWCYLGQDNATRAVPPIKRSLLIRTKLFGEKHQFVGDCLYVQAVLDVCQNQYSKAESNLEQSIEIWEKSSGAHFMGIPEALACQSACFQHKGKQLEAESLVKRAFTVEEGMREDGFDLAMLLNHRAAIFSLNSKYEFAEPLLKLCLQIREKRLGANSSPVAWALCFLADCYEHEGKFAQAEPLLRRALAIKWEKPDEAFESERLAKVINDLANSARKQDKFAEAEELQKRAAAL